MWERSSDSSNNACGEDSRGAQPSRRSTNPTWFTLMHDSDMICNKYEKLTKHRNSNKENVDNRKTLLAITVEIDDGCSGCIEMKEGDSAEGVATKFCHDYSLPDDFVAPLAEHILDNIIRISKRDKNIFYCSTEELDAYEARLKQVNCPDDSDSSHLRKSSCESGCQCQDSDSRTPLAQSQLGNRPPRTLLKTKSILAEQLHCWRCPTHSCGSETFKVEKMKRRKRRRSDIAKVGCLRLYNDFLDRRQRRVQLWRKNVRQFCDKVNKTRIEGPKKSWGMYRKRCEIAKMYKNYGELLYAEGLIMKEKLLKKSQSKNRKDEELEMVGFTGMPKITQKARHMLRPKGCVWHKLAAVKYNFDHIHDEMTEARMAECTFKPQINPSPNCLTNASISRFDRLFYDSESRCRRQQRYADLYQEGLTFQPAINRRTNECGCQVSVFDRLSLSPRRCQEKKATVQDNCLCRYGRGPLRTQSGRKVQFSRNPKNLPVKVFLPEMQAARLRKKEAMVKKKEQTVTEQAKCNHATLQSQKLLTWLKPMFSGLDTDKDGLIQLCKVDTRRVSTDAARVINTLIKLGKGNQCLTFDAFQRLVQKIEKCHKGSIVRGHPRHVNHVDTSDMKFEYKVPGGLPSDLADKERDFSTSDNWYDILLQDAQKRQQAVDALRQERQKIEMQKCTFAPELNLTKPNRKINLKLSHSHFRPRSAPHAPVKCHGASAIYAMQCKGKPHIPLHHKGLNNLFTGSQ